MLDLANLWKIIHPSRLIEEKKKSKQVLEESRREEQEKLALFQAEVKEVCQHL